MLNILVYLKKIQNQLSWVFKETVRHIFNQTGSDKSVAGIFPFRSALFVEVKVTKYAE